MTTREKFKRKIIELTCKEPFKEKSEIFVISESQRKEIENQFKKFGNFFYKEDLERPITIGRVMQAFKNKNLSVHFILKEDLSFLIIKKDLETKAKSIDWQLTKENGQEATDDLQTDEAIEKLLELLEK